MKDFVSVYGDHSNNLELARLIYMYW